MTSHATSARAKRWLLALMFLGACSSEITPATQLLVALSADPGVAAQLSMVKVSSYALGSTDAMAPFAQQVFALTSDLPGAQRTRLPFSFGVARGEADALLLVVEGYASPDATSPVIERKLAVRFVDGETTPLDLSLVEPCYGRAAVCAPLDQTCYPVAVGSLAAGECGPVGNAPPRAVQPHLDAGASALDAAGADAKDLDAAPGDGRGEQSGDTGLPLTPADDAAFTDAAGDSSLTTLKGCRGENVCRDPAYPCVPSTTTGYSCLGQMAEWPMPDGVPGSKFAPSLSAMQDVVIDNVTGLIWQRVLPDSYAGCPVVNEPSKLSGCTWAEAKAYCEQLPLEGAPWRLPSMVELASILDERKGLPALDADAFPGLGEKNGFWTASPSTGLAGRAFVIGFSLGDVFHMPFDTTLSVRCVRSVLTRPGHPGGRYDVDAAGDAITDTRTKLTWQRTLHGPAVDYAQAEAYCAGLGDGYRLPAYKELLTLVDPSAGEKPIDRALPRVPDASFFWSSSPALSDMGKWVVGLGWVGFGYSNVVPVFHPRSHWNPRRPVFFY